MEADRVAVPFRYRTIKIVVQQNTRHTTPRVEAGGMAAQKAFHPGIRKEAQKNLPRVAEHHDEGHQRTPDAAEFQMPEVTPVDLGLLTRQIAQMQLGRRFRTRPVAGDQMADVIGAFGMAAFAHHSVTTARRQRRECLQRLVDEGQICVDL